MGCQQNTVKHIYSKVILYDLRRHFSGFNYAEMVRVRRRLCLLHQTALHPCMLTLGFADENHNCSIIHKLDGMVVAEFCRTVVDQNSKQHRARACWLLPFCQKVQDPVTDACIHFPWPQPLYQLLWYKDVLLGCNFSFMCVQRLYSKTPQCWLAL